MKKLCNYYSVISHFTDHTVTDRSSVILTVDRLTKKFGRHFVAVRDINFQVSAGECFGLLGVNGCLLYTSRCV